MVMPTMVMPNGMNSLACGSDRSACKHDVSDGPGGIFLQEFTSDIAVNMIAGLAATALLTIIVAIINKFTARAVNARTDLLRKDWVGRFSVSAFCNMASHLTFAYAFAVFYKWSQKRWMMYKYIM